MDFQYDPFSLRVKKTGNQDSNQFISFLIWTLRIKLHLYDADG